MLQVAQRRVPRVVAGDLRALPLRSKFARITCLYDSLNHMLDANDLAAAFRAVRGVMDRRLAVSLRHEPSRDLSRGVGHLRAVHRQGPRLPPRDRHDLPLAREDRPRRTSPAGRTSAASASPIHEQHRQRAYSEREIVKALDAADLVPVDVLDFDPYGEAEAVNAATVKLFFVCTAEVSVASARRSHLPKRCCGCGSGA